MTIDGMGIMASAILLFSVLYLVYDLFRFALGKGEDIADDGTVAEF